MPTRPLKPCCHGGCGVLTRERYCGRHRTASGSGAHLGRTTAQRGYGGRWQRLRLLVLKRDPICRGCRRAPSAEVDHIIPKARGGDDSLENLQGLCKPCHSRKTMTIDGGARGKGG